MSQIGAPNMIIGACEWVALPELGIRRLRARVDTGARSCALHASAIEAFELNGQPMVSFRVHTGYPKARAWQDCQSALVAVRRVRSTSGRLEQRYTISTALVIGHSRWDVIVTLSDRRKMRYRMLLGRTAMENHALVYPARAFLQGRPRLD